MNDKIIYLTKQITTQVHSIESVILATDRNGAKIVRSARNNSLTRAENSQMVRILVDDLVKSWRGNL